MLDVEGFNRWAPSYEQSWLQRWFFQPVHRRVLELAMAFPTPATVLDVGCGTGRLLRTARAQWPEARLVGVDPAAAMIEVARTLDPTAAFYVAPAEKLPLPDNSTDLAVSTTSLHHWQDRGAGVREVARVLRPGGRFILADFVVPAWLARLTGNTRWPTLATRTALFEGAGLQIILERSGPRPWVVLTVGQKVA